MKTHGFALVCFLCAVACYLLFSSITAIPFLVVAAAADVMAGIALMRTVCTRLRGVHLVAGAGHSISEEQPEQVNKLLLGFLREVTVN